MCLLKALSKTGSFDECNMMHGIERTNLKRHQLKNNKDLRIEVGVTLGHTEWNCYSACIFFFPSEYLIWSIRRDLKALIGVLVKNANF